MYKTAISIVLISLFCSGIVILTVFYHSYDKSKWPNDYAVVIDAGSSGTRTYLFEWKAGLSAAKGDDLVVSQKTSCKLRDKGIDKLDSKEEFIDKVSPCLKAMENEIPQDRMSRAYLFLAATAGMRLLEARNKTASDEIFGFIREHFKNTGFLFKNDSQVRILSGKEEGTNAWISANYYKNNFKNKEASLVKTSDTAGILDLGGGSTQIVFVPENQTAKHSNFFSDIRIYGVNYKPYSHSFLCWGQNEIALLYQRYLLSKNGFNIKGTSHCYPSNFVKILDSNKLLQSSCANGILTKDTLEFSKESSKILKDSSYKFEGLSDFEKCQEEVANLFPKSNCKYESCSFNGVYMPTIDKNNIMGFSGFYYALTNTELLFKAKMVDDFELFKLKTSEICSMNLDQLQNLNTESGANLPMNFVTNQCFTNVYILEIFKSYGIASFSNLQITKKINGNKLNWALGYLINELNRDDFLPYEQPPRKLKFEFFLPLTILAVLGILATLTLLALYKLRKNRAKSNKGIDALECTDSNLIEVSQI